MKKIVAIVHFNTPELTEAAILSVRKHGGKDYRIVVFDNSDKRPFPKRDDVEIIDNTQGQIINFEHELAKYPNKDRFVGGINNYGSDKHMMSVQKLWELLPDGFVLMDSDVLIKESFDWMFMPNECCCGYVSTMSPNPRLMPMLLWINVPMCKAGGARFFDPTRSWALNKGSRWDTGAAFLDDIKRLKPQCHGKKISREVLLRMIVHYKRGSWGRADIKTQAKWLSEHANLWKPTPSDMGIKDIAICAIGRHENRYAVEWVEHYKKLGVKKIFVYDNYFGNEEKLADVLQKYVDSGFVDLIDCHDRIDMQCRAYEQCYRLHGNEYAWIGYFDFDELLRCKGKKKLPDIMAQYTNGDLLLVNWRIMTDNGLTFYEDKPMAKRFTQPMLPLDKPVKYTRPENEHIKCFVRGGNFDIKFGANPHCPDSPKLICINPSGKRVKQGAFAPIDHSVMWLDHYFTKTAEEWMDVKLSRGYHGNERRTANILAHHVERFFAVNERTPEKEAILRGEKIEHEIATNGDHSIIGPEQSKPKTTKRKNSKNQNI